MSTTPAQRRALRTYYTQHRKRITKQQAAYQRRTRPARADARSHDTANWRARFKRSMVAAGYPGRDGHGLSPEGYRWRENNGLQVPPWPALADPPKSRRARRP